MNIIVIGNTPINGKYTKIHRKATIDGIVNYLYSFQNFLTMKSARKIIVFATIPTSRVYMK